MREDPVGGELARDPKELLGDAVKMQAFRDIMRDIVKGVVIDPNHETRDLGETFDYKSMLKSREQILKLGGALIASYKKDVARGKADTIAGSLAQTQG